MKINPNILVYRYLLFILACWPAAVFSQVADFDQLVLPEGQRPTNFEDYLVQLAWLNNPEAKILDLEKNKAQKEVDLQKTEWMDDIQFGFNINEVSLSNVLNPSDDNLVLYPLYQFSAGVSLGSFTNNKKKRQREEFDVKIAEWETNQHKLKIRAETLARYQKLLLSIETLKVRTKAEEDSRNTYDFALKRFNNADLELDDLLRASEAYNNAQEKRLTAETDIRLSKLAMEEIIGVKWEAALRYEERMKK